MGRRVKIPEATELTGLKEYTLRKGIREGRYPHIRTSGGSGRILIDLELLEDFLRQEAIDSVRPRYISSDSEVVNYGKLRVIKQ